MRRTTTNHTHKLEKEMIRHRVKIKINRGSTLWQIESDVKGGLIYLSLSIAAPNETSHSFIHISMLYHVSP